MEVNLLMIIVIVGVLGGFGLIAWKMGWFGKKKEDYKIVNRTPIEKGKRILQLRHNGRFVRREIKDEAGKVLYSFNEEYKTLTLGTQLKGGIISITPHEIVKDKETRRLYEIVFKVPWVKWRMIALYLGGVTDIMIVGENVMSLDPMRKRITISPDVGISGISAWHYDQSNERAALNIVQDQIHKSDWEDLGNRYFAEGQKASAIPTAYGKELATKELELQIEKEKRAKLISG